MKQLPRRFNHHRGGVHTSTLGFEEPSFRPVSQTSVDSDSDPEPSRPPRLAAGQLKPLLKSTLTSEPAKSTDSEIDDIVPSKGKSKKTVAIDTSQNKHFSHRLIPVRSPEFDNVIDQVGLVSNYW